MTLRTTYGKQFFDTETGCRYCDLRAVEVVLMEYDGVRKAYPVCTTHKEAPLVADDVPGHEVDRERFIDGD